MYSSCWLLKSLSLSFLPLLRGGQIGVAPSYMYQGEPSYQNWLKLWNAIIVLKFHESTVILIVFQFFKSWSSHFSFARLWKLWILLNILLLSTLWWITVNSNQLPNYYLLFYCSANDYTHVFGSNSTAGVLTPHIACCFSRYLLTWLNSNLICY